MGGFGIVVGMFEAALVTAFALTFSAFCAYSIIRGVLWFAAGGFERRDYNDPDTSYAGFFRSRRALASSWIRAHNMLDDSGSGNADTNSPRAVR